MSFLSNLEELLTKIKAWLYLFISLTFFFFAFGPGEVELAGKKFTFIKPGIESFSTLVFNKLKNDLLTEKIELIVTNPLEALWAQIGISLFLAFCFSFPYFIYKVILFFTPALTKKEKNLVKKSLTPSIILFFSGAIFSYYFLIPLTFKILYKYVELVGARSFFDVGEFVFYILALVGGVGALFMFPVLMVALTKFGLVSSKAWKDNWRYALIGFLIFAAIITPDGSGVTMLILCIPLTVLYLGGYIISRRIEN